MRKMQAVMCTVRLMLILSVTSIILSSFVESGGRVGGVLIARQAIRKSPRTTAHNNAGIHQYEG